MGQLALIQFPSKKKKRLSCPVECEFDWLY